MPYKDKAAKKARDRAYHAEHPGAQSRRLHANGKVRPMSEAKDCSMYLGVFVAERALSKYFNHVKRMPYSNPGYDFECDRGFKIDAKSACLYNYNHEKRTAAWYVRIRKNVVADYFMVLLFNNRNDLEPMHLYLIPGRAINHLDTLSITNSPRSLARLAQYERPLDKVVSCCSEMREWGQA